MLFFSDIYDYHACPTHLHIISIFAAALVSNIRTRSASYINNNAPKKIFARHYCFNLIWYFNVRQADNCEYKTYAQSYTDYKRFMGHKETKGCLAGPMTRHVYLSPSQIPAEPP